MTESQIHSAHSRHQGMLEQINPSRQRTVISSFLILFSLVIFLASCDSGSWIQGYDQVPAIKAKLLLEEEAVDSLFAAADSFAAYHGYEIRRGRLLAVSDDEYPVQIDVRGEMALVHAATDFEPEEIDIYFYKAQGKNRPDDASLMTFANDLVGALAAVDGIEISSLPTFVETMDEAQND